MAPKKEPEVKKPPTKKVLANTPPEGAVAQEWHKERARRSLKPWDLRNSKKYAEKGAKADSYPEFLKIWNELKARKIAPAKKRHHKIARFTILNKKPKGKKNQRKTMPKQFTKGERSLKKTWSWKMYERKFGVYASKENLVRFFVKYGKGLVPKEQIPGFVNFNYKKHMNLVSLVARGRKSLSAKLGSFKLRHACPAIVKKGGRTLRQLKKDAAFKSWLFKSVFTKDSTDKFVLKINSITLSYVVNHIRLNGLLGPDAKQTILNYAKDTKRHGKSRRTPAKKSTKKAKPAPAPKAAPKKKGQKKAAPKPKQ